MEIGMTRLSSKGQVIIPQNMRKNFKPGDKLVVMNQDGRLIIKKADKLDENFSEDLEFAKRTEEAWKKYDRGEFTKMSKEDFFKEIEKW